MRLTLWLSRRKARAPRPSFRPTLQMLEGRWVPSTVTVTNNLDSGAGSLRAAIANAPNGSTINFAPNLNGQTITLSSGELDLKKNLTIVGPGNGQVAISANNKSRVFEVPGSKNVTLSGLTISYGTAAEGGGILNYGTLTVSNCVLSHDTATNNGGGIGNEGTLTVIGGSVISDNVGGYAGGGISNIGRLTISGSTLSGNSAGTGGGIQNYTGTVTINAGSILASNSSGSNGGGIYDTGAGGTVTIDGCTLSGNSAFSGGAVYADRGTVTISGSAVTGNSARFYGGGICLSNDTGPYAPWMTVGGCTLTGNSAGRDGGGIYNPSSRTGALTLSYTTFSMNTPDDIVGSWSDGGGNTFV